MYSIKTFGSWRSHHTGTPVKFNLNEKYSSVIYRSLEVENGDLVEAISVNLSWATDNDLCLLNGLVL